MPVSKCTDKHLAAVIDRKAVWASSARMPTRSAPDGSQRVQGPSDVSIRAPARGATYRRRGRRLARQVSIHAPARGATHRTRGGSGLLQVSIHAPARGATSAGDELTLAWLFQSTRPRGARLYSVVPDGTLVSFQSTRPRGARPRRPAHGAGDEDVSIHAPARGATACWDAYERQTIVSIHAPVRGATAVASTPTSGTRFQSTRPRGARLATYGASSVAMGFNPRAREGRDEAAISNSPQSWSFQSTRPRGARQKTRGRLTRICQFQSTRPRGARR